jgi:hypothetical protein
VDCAASKPTGLASVQKTKVPPAQADVTAALKTQAQAIFFIFMMFPQQ